MRKSLGQCGNRCSVWIAETRAVSTTSSTSLLVLVATALVKQLRRGWPSDPQSEGHVIGVNVYTHLTSDLFPAWNQALKLAETACCGIPRFIIFSMNDNVQSIADAVIARLRPLLQQRAVQPRLLTVAQAAVYLGRTEKAIRHLVASGSLPSVRSDLWIMMDVQDMDAWIRANKA